MWRSAAGTFHQTFSFFSSPSSNSITSGQRPSVCVCVCVCVCVLCDFVFSLHILLNTQAKHFFTSCFLFCREGFCWACLLSCSVSLDVGEGVVSADQQSARGWAKVFSPPKHRILHDKYMLFWMLLLYLEDSGLGITSMGGPREPGPLTFGRGAALYSFCKSLSFLSSPLNEKSICRFFWDFKSMKFEYELALFSAPVACVDSPWNAGRC